MLYTKIIKVLTCDAFKTGLQVLFLLRYMKINIL